MARGSYLSIIPLNVNGLNSPIKRQERLNGYKNRTSIYDVYKRPTSSYRLKVKGWKKIFHANRDQKKAGVAILVSDKMTLK